MMMIVFEVLIEHERLFNELQEFTPTSTGNLLASTPQIFLIDRFRHGCSDLQKFCTD